MLVLPEYIHAAMRRADYETIEESDSIFVTIPGFDGLWASGQTKHQASEELEAALEGWILLSIRLGHELPIIDDIDLTVREVA